MDLSEPGYAPVGSWWFAVHGLRVVAVSGYLRPGVVWEAEGPSLAVVRVFAGEPPKVNRRGTVLRAGSDPRVQVSFLPASGWFSSPDELDEFAGLIAEAARRLEVELGQGTADPDQLGLFSEGVQP